jgi:beta-glucosidase
VKSARLDLRAGQAREISVEYSKGEKGASIELLWATPPPDPFQEAIEAARAADVALVFAGLNTDCEGENLDRFSMDLPGLQDELIQSVVKANPRTVVVLFSGTPNRMTRWIDQVPAVVQAWYPGIEGGNAIADVLFGDVNPSGKLPVTFARHREEYPDWPNFPGQNDVVRYSESIFVGYRHFDAKKIMPLYPFGHGLSYATFEYSNLNVQPMAGDNEIEVSLEVKNTGSREGREVVQLYVSDLKSRLPRPNRKS